MRRRMAILTAFRLNGGCDDLWDFFLSAKSFTEKVRLYE
jgi:hypothetical protein